jgi:hypothetical protein
MDIVPEHSSGDPVSTSSAKTIRHVEHYWLCGACSRSLTLVLDKGQVVAVPVKLRAAAS